MKITFAAGRELAYHRNSQIINALEQEHQVHLLTATASRLTTRLLRVGWKLLRQRSCTDTVFFIGFYGQPLVFPARLRYKGPLILDAFVSTYDTFCFDRQLFEPRSLPGQMAFQLDRLSCQTADIVVVDTFAHAKYFEQTFGIPRSRIHVLYAGCDDHLFKPVKVSPPDEPIVLFYGSYLPLHGVDIILRAAGQMTDERVRFVLIGRGQEYRTTRALALELELSNAKFANPVPLESLPGIIAQSTICLGGHFGHSEKASRVIAGKTFQCLAVEKPTIVGDNPANRELFTHGKDVWMCPMADPTALANAIRHLLDSPQLRTQLGKSGREVILRSCGNAATSQAIHTIIEAAVATHQSGSPRTAS